MLSPSNLQKCWTFWLSLAKKFCLQDHGWSLGFLSLLLLVSPSWSGGTQTSTFLDSFLSVNVFVKARFVVAAGAQKCRRTWDCNSLLNSAQNQSHANSWKNYFHDHCSKMEPYIVCSAPSPGPWDPHCCLCWRPQAACSHTSRLPEQEEFRRALRQAGGWGAKRQAGSTIPQ